MLNALRFTLAAGVAAACVGSAGAADLARPAPMPYVAPVAVGPSWTGFYLGFNGGWGWSNYNVSEAPFGVTGIADILPQALGTSNDGAVFGGQIGYNWQIASWVLGIEADWDGANISSTNATVFPSILGGPGTTHTNSFTTNEKIGELASIRGRLGYVWGPAMLYFTGGGAWENVTTNATISANTAGGNFGQSANASFSTTRSGFVLGAGVEWMATPSWLIRAEYLHYDFSGANTNTLGIANCAVPGCGVNVTTASNNVDVFRMGASYKLDWFR
jgi:outer membrane immunogenic protein